MDRIPDEILTDILSNVTYSGQQHQTLALVNHRFNNVVNSGVYRAKVAYHRYSDFALLLNSQSLTAEEFADIAWREARIEELLDHAIDSNIEHENTRRMVKVCLILIDYITSLNDGDSRKASLLLEWLKKRVFEKEWTAMLRYSLWRVFDKSSRPDWYMEVADQYKGHAGPLLAALKFDRDHWHCERLNMCMMRAFETAVFARTDKVTFLESVFSSGVMDLRLGAVDDTECSGKRMFTRLAKTYLHACVKYMPLTPYTDADLLDMFKVLRAFDWRPLSEVVAAPYVLSADTNKPLISRIIANILSTEGGEENYYKKECTQTAGPWEWMLELINFDFEAIGKSIRSARESISSGKVPENIVKAADSIFPPDAVSSLQALLL